MPFNSSGVYTLPLGSFVTGTVISSSAMNQQLNDIANNGLTNCLAKTGVSTMTGQLKAISGNAMSPAYTFGGNLTDGIYLAGTHQVGITTNSIQAVTINSDQSVTFDGNITVDGTSTFTGAITLNATSYTFGAGAATALVAALAFQVDFAGFIDGNGSVITTGQKLWVHAPFKATITGWRVAADQVGSITIDILRQSGSAPGGPSMVGVGGNTPSLSSQSFNFASPTGWTSTTINSDDWLTFSVTGSPSNVTKLNLTLICTRLTPS